MNDYADELKKMTWSFSRIHCYEQCPYEFYLNYLLKDADGHRIYEKIDNFYGVFGSLCHELLQKLLVGQIQLDDAIYEYVTEFDARLSGIEVRESVMEKYREIGMLYFQNVQFDWLQDWTVLGVEKKVNFSIGDYAFVGFIDLLIQNKDSGEIVLVDHKTSQWPLGVRGNVLKNQQKSFNAYQRQLYLYCKPVMEMYGQAPSVLAWNYLQSRQWLRHGFVDSEYEDALLWAEETIHQIEQDDVLANNFDYFYCHNLCGFREGACEYINGEEDDI